MTREDFIRRSIAEKGLTIKSFAKSAGIPYTTLLSILDSSLGGAGMDTVIKICDALGVSVDVFQSDAGGKDAAALLTARERRVIEAYRERGDMRRAVDRLLGVEEDGPEE